jgi:hypothetical protein
MRRAHPIHRITKTQVHKPVKICKITHKRRPARIREYMSKMLYAG